MVEETKKYTTQLQAGLGLIEETKTLLSIYEEGMTVTQLHEVALNSGQFPMMTARRLRNLIAECFSPRYLKPDVARYLKTLNGKIENEAFDQLLLMFTSLANLILIDFIKEVYWAKYLGGQDTLSREDAADFVENAVREGKTGTHWSETTIKRVSSYLLGCCMDFGLLHYTKASVKNIKSLRINKYVMLFMIYWFHFQGIADNRIINDDIWQVFGLQPSDIREELKNISRNGWIIVQSAGDITSLSWQYSNIEEVINVIIDS